MIRVPPKSGSGRLRFALPLGVVGPGRALGVGLFLVGTGGALRSGADGFLSLFLALGSGLAGALSIMRGAGSALVGVAIAVALVPPAATSGAM